MRAELDLVPSTCSSSYSYMDPASDAPIDNSGPMSDSDVASLPLATDILISQPPLRSIPTSDCYIDSKTNPADIINIEWDLGKTQTVDFATMVKMFLVRRHINVSSRADIDGLTNRVPALMKEADAEYMELLEQAINFCNLDTKASSSDKDRVALCKYVKQHMRAFCNAKVETDRYLPIVNVLNAILSLDDGSEAVFIRNDPMFVESIHLPTPKTKPGVVLIELESGRKWLGIEESGTFQQCRETAGEVEVQRKVRGRCKGKGKPREKPKERNQKKTGKGKAEVHQEETHAWTPVEQFWEFKMSKRLYKLSLTLRSGSSFKMENLTLPTDSAPEGVPKSSSMPGKRQLSNELENPRPTKRTREASVAPVTLEPDDDVQCAYYAIELLRVSWKASHASGILLKDELLEILWYDPQGCVRTIPIDIVRQLPLLVVLVRAQRRSKYLSGLRKTFVPGDFELINQAIPRFQLVGRMSSLGKLKVSTPLTSTQISDEDEATHFFKSSWPEDIRPREHYIIATAINRAKEYLPDRFRHFVLDHLPIVSASDEIHDTSTAIIRILLGLSTEGARTQYLMCSNLLSDLLGVADNFALFREVLRDVVRAHRLLWVIGISHGDVSFHNIMMQPDSKVGVLNDFDLASVMKPGAKSPPKVGFRRTGTPMFMAAELLCDEALSPRFYRHDLESFAWILLYASICVKDGVENLDVDPFRKWVSTGTSRLYEKKMLFLQTSWLTLQRVPDNQWLLSTFSVWFDAIVVGGYKQKLGPGDESALLGKVLRAWEIDEEEWENFSLPAVQGSSKYIQDSASASAKVLL